VVVDEDRGVVLGNGLAVAREFKYHRVRLCLQVLSQASPAGDDVAHEEIMAVEAV
jgi:hypothetical protein